MRRLLLLAASLMAFSLAPGAGRADLRNPYAVAVIIGNKTYQNRDIPEVKFADRDAEAIKRYAIDVLGYSDENIIFVENATQGRLLSVFGSADAPRGQLARWLRPGGKSDVLVYYSGHGVPGVSDGQSYLLPVDADPSSVSQNGYPLTLLYENLQKIGARSVTVLLDACFSGASAGGTLMGNASVVTRPASPVPAADTGGLTVLTAARADQLANWDGRHRHGLFTEYFLEAVYGRADDAQYGGHGDGRITLSAVHKYLDDEMRYIAQREDGRDQNATVTGDPGFLLASLTPDTAPPRHDDAAPAPAPVPQAAPAPAIAPAIVAPTADELARQGVAALERKDFPAALALFRQAAALGHSESIRNVGVMYAAGQGVAQDHAAALKWFRQAADKGNAHAMNDIGRAYELGNGVAQDYAEAMRWYRKAADKGNPLAMYNIGWLYDNGRGVAQDYAEAMRWYRMAAEQGDAHAMTNIGALFGKGHGVAHDEAEALRWYRQAADKGNVVAMRNIGMHYKTGLGVPADLGEARRWLAKAADLGDQTARDELAKL